MTEKESLLVLNQEIKSDLSFCRDCAVSQGATGWVRDFDRLLDKNEILNNKLNQQFSSRSKLSIPKKIAEEVEKVNRNRYIGAEEFSEIVYDWLYDPKSLGISEVSEEEYKKTGWVYSETDRKEISKLRNKRENIIRAYLAGKALGVELVEVEG